MRSRVKATADGGYVLDYGSGMTWFAIISAFLLMIMLITAAFGSTKPGDASTTTAIGYMSLFVILVWPLFIEGTFSWYIVNNEGIDKHSAWSRHLFMRWDEVESIEFTAVNQWFVIKGNKGTIRLHAYLIGLPEFAKIVRKHVPEERWERAGELINGLADGVNNGEVSGINAEQDGSTSKGKARKIKVERSTDAENDVRIQ